MRKVIAYFIKYHVAVNVFILFFVVFGIIGALSLKSSFFPLIETKIINIEIVFPGASPQEVEEGVILKIEDNLKGIEGIDRVTSVSSENSGLVTVEILKGYNIDFMLLEVKNAVDRVPSFPVGMEPPIVSKRDEVRESISFAISGENVSLKTLKDIAREVENDLRAIPGISQIELSGFPDEEIEIAVDQNALLAYDLSFQEVADAVAQYNILVTGGSIKTDREEYLIRAKNRNYYADAFSEIPIKTTPLGATIKLRDVATARDRFEETPTATYFNNRLSVKISVTSTNSEDLIESANIVNEYITDFNAQYDNIEIVIERDFSITLNQRTQLLFENATIGMALVILFLSLFLNIRLAFWVAFGLPIAFLGMFVFAPGFDITINVISLFGMIVVIGILVDDGIVIAENIYQQYEKGKSPINAAIDGTMEVLPPILSAVTTTCLAFAIFLFLDSRIGEFYSELATLVILTLVVSLVEALIILPAHLAHSKALQSKEARKKQGVFFKFMRGLNHHSERLMFYVRDTLYLPVLRFSIKYKLLAFSIFVLFFAITLGSIMAGKIKISLFPSIASDRVQVNLVMPQGTNERITDSIISMIEDKAALANEELTEKYLKGEQYDGLVLFESVIKEMVNASSANLIINMLPGESRPDEVRADIVSNYLKDLVGPVIGVERLIFNSGGNFGGSPVSVSLLSNDLEALKGAKNMLKQRLSENPALINIADNNPEGIKEIRINLKPSAYALGYTLQSVVNQVRSGFFGLQAQRFQRGQDEIRVWVRYDEPTRQSLENLDDMRIISPQGQRVPLREIVDYEIIRGVVNINHLDGRREIQVTADLKNPNDSSIEMMNEVKEQIMPEILAQYPGIRTSFEGQNREAGKLSRSASKVIPLIFFLIIAVIAFTFRSYSQPILLLLLLPFSLIAVAWGHVIHGFSLNVLSLLGIVALIGIMVNDGLVLITKFNSYLREGLGFDEALFSAGKSRFRAIFLTSATTIAGLAPLIFEKSRQAQFLKPMAISIAYGIGFATVLTLLLLPIFLGFSNSIKKYTLWLFTGKNMPKEKLERAVKEQLEENEYEHEK